MFDESYGSRLRVTDACHNWCDYTRQKKDRLLVKYSIAPRGDATRTRRRKKNPIPLILARGRAIRCPRERQRKSRAENLPLLVYLISQLSGGIRIFRENSAERFAKSAHTLDRVSLLLRRIDAEFKTVSLAFHSTLVILLRRTFFRRAGATTNAKRVRKFNRLQVHADSDQRSHSDRDFYAPTAVSERFIFLPRSASSGDLGLEDSIFASISLLLPARVRSGTKFKG